jgi:hypothetical protein
MERSPVKSSFLATIGYSPESATLEVAFKSGRIYQYFGVEPEVHKSLVGAESVGRFYSVAIASKYESRRATELEPKDAEEPQADLAI